MAHDISADRSSIRHDVEPADGADVLRNEEGRAIIGDPRNDSHVFVSQMHLAFARAHNAFVDRARAIGVAEARVSEHAARELRWHYQSVVLREFLPRLIGSPLKSGSPTRPPSGRRSGRLSIS
jgi:hypothetical protein